jgi:hypothetical protein
VGCPRAGDARPERNGTTARKCRSVSGKLDTGSSSSACGCCCGAAARERERVNAPG